MAKKKEVVKDANYYRKDVVRNRLIKTINNEMVQYGRRHVYEVFDDMMNVWAIAISNRLVFFDEKREAKYFAVLDKYGKDWMMKAAHLLDDLRVLYQSGEKCDLLGEVFHELDIHNPNRGQYFTPYEVCLLMAKLTATPDIESQIGSKGFITVNEPTCGSGAMIMAFAKTVEDLGYDVATQTACVAQDIDRRAVQMCYVQLALAGIPAVVIQGDTLKVECLESWYTPALVRNDGLYKLGYNSKPTTRTGSRKIVN